MATKRRAGPELVSNPFIKKRNLEWHLDLTPTKTPAPPPAESPPAAKQPTTTTSAAIEAGEAAITDHSAHFSSLLSAFALTPYPQHTPRLPLASYKALYDSSLHNPSGSHFVIHQHDHPVAGVHYDLRLQISGSSSASWAVMYGLPGDANSARLNRNATETRVHCLWNHLIETASAQTGSLLIWDTGTYRVLRRRSKHAPAVDPESESSTSEAGDGDDDAGEAAEVEGEQAGGGGGKTEQEKLADAFASRKIRLQLDGARLPRRYVLNLRLTKGEDAAARSKAARAASSAAPRGRRRKQKHTAAPEPVETSSSSGSSDADDGNSDPDPTAGSQDAGGSNAIEPVAGDHAALSAMERELRELEDETVQRTNAYTGAENTIGSVHQRRWYLSLDRKACGFVKWRRDGRVVWEKSADKGEGEIGAEASRLSFPFYVRGPESERSVVTGRLGVDILRDEGIVGHVSRKGWRPVLN